MPELKFKQIAIGQWAGARGNTFTVVALSEDGRVYKFLRDGWVPLPDKPTQTAQTARTASTVSKADGPQSTDEDPW